MPHPIDPNLVSLTPREAIAFHYLLYMRPLVKGSKLTLAMALGLARRRITFEDLKWRPDLVPPPDPMEPSRAADLARRLGAFRKNGKSSARIAAADRGLRVPLRAPTPTVQSPSEQ